MGCYPGGITAALNNYCTVVVGKLLKARKSWACLSIILGMEGVNTRASGMFFKAVVQAVLIFREETWLTTPRMGRTLGEFQ